MALAFGSGGGSNGGDGGDKRGQSSSENGVGIDRSAKQWRESELVLR